MKNREEANFKQWKRRKLYEGFLDGEDEKPVTAEESAPEETKEEQPADDDANLVADEEQPAEETSDEKSEGDISDEADEGEPEDDGLDDDFEGENTEETGVEGTDNAEITELKDAIATLTTQIQTLTDQMVKANGGDETSEETPSEENGDELAPEEETSDTETSEEESSEKSEEESSEGDSEESSETEEEPKDDTKSEAYNYYCKKGNILSENSGYMISILNEGRFDKLEDNIMAVVKAKIRQRIENAKSKLRTDAFNKKFGE
mgnify:CR=1 FL=1